eukprot:4952118-Heterocapsa_arctica.AAC.1
MDPIAHPEDEQPLKEQAPGDTSTGAIINVKLNEKDGHQDFKSILTKLYGEGYNFAVTKQDTGIGPSLWAASLGEELNTHIKLHYRDLPSSPLDQGAPEDTCCSVQGMAVPFQIEPIGTCWRMALQNTRPIYNHTNVLDKKRRGRAACYHVRRSQGDST